MKTQGAALKAQAEQAQLAEKVRELEEQLAAIARWETVVQHYKLRALVPDVFVYEYVAPTWDSEPSHFACANCFQLCALHPAQTASTHALPQWILPRTVSE